jgi:CBS domain-containing protein
MVKQRTIDKKQLESGMPGGGAGRKDEGLGKSGVYPMSGPHPPGDAQIITPGSWGQGARGGAGYEDHGESELIIYKVKPEKCRDLMTKDPVCCLATDNADKAAQLMKQYDIGALTVVDDQGQKVLQGIITDRDIALRAFALNRDPRTITVGEIMSHDIVTCSPDDDCNQALRLMEEHRIRRIPAVDRTGRVVGIISQADVALRVHETSKTAELVTEISRPR